MITVLNNPSRFAVFALVMFLPLYLPDSAKASGFSFAYELPSEITVVIGGLSSSAWPVTTGVTGGSFACRVVLRRPLGSTVFAGATADDAVGMISPTGGVVAQVWGDPTAGVMSFEFFEWGGLYFSGFPSQVSTSGTFSVGVNPAGFSPPVGDVSTPSMLEPGCVWVTVPAGRSTLNATVSSVVYDPWRVDDGSILIWDGFSVGFFFDIVVSALSFAYRPFVVFLHSFGR